MNDSILTYIWVSLENLNVAMKSQQPFYKAYLPVISAFVGVFVGFAINQVSEKLKSRRMEHQHKKIFMDELEIIKGDMAVIIPKLYSFLDGVLKDKDLRASIYSPKIIYLGFEDFYPKIIHILDLDSKKLIRKIYNDADKINESIKEFEWTITPDEDYMKHTIMASKFAMDCVSMYMDCKNMIDGVPGREWNLSDVLCELNINSEFHEGFKKSILNER